jgi:hypothetical protein
MLIQRLRRLLVVDNSGELSSLVVNFRQAGWEVTVSTLDEAFKQSAEVGLIHLGPYRDDFAALRQLVCRHPALWVAVVSPENLLNSDTC